MANSWLPFALLAMLLAGCSGGGGGGGDDGGDTTDEDPTDPGMDGNQTGGGGNGTGEMPLEEPCDTDTGYQEVNGNYVKADAGGSSVYQESNGIADVQTEDSCPSNPDTKLQAADGGGTGPPA